MPTYDFECDVCGKVEERVISYDDLHVPCYHLDCGGRMKHIVTRGHGGVVCYGPGHPREEWGGPKGYKKYLARENRIECGDASVDEFNKFMDNVQKEDEAKIDKMAQDMAERTMRELGEDLYLKDRAPDPYKRDMPEMHNGGQDVLKQAAE